MQNSCLAGEKSRTERRESRKLMKINKKNVRKQKARVKTFKNK